MDRAFRGSHPLALSIDHVVPIIAKGDDSLANLQVAHLGCNAAKGSSLPACSALVGVCAMNVVAGIWLWHGRRRGAVLALATSSARSLPPRQ